MGGDPKRRGAKQGFEVGRPLSRQSAAKVNCLKPAREKKKSELQTQKYPVHRQQ